MLAVLLLAGLPLLGACSRSVAFLDRNDRGDALMQRALARQNEGDPDSAIRLYLEALDQNPRLVRAHLDVALLLHDAKKDYVRAVYHYARYLESRPSAEKQGLIEDRLRLAKQAFAASLLKPERYSSDRVMALEVENARLTNEVRRLEAQLADVTTKLRSSEEARAAAARPAGAPAGGGVAAPARPAADPARPREPRTYRVQRGDSLSIIAVKMYEDPMQWRRILEANKAVLKNSDRLVEGQVLTIP